MSAAAEAPSSVALLVLRNLPVHATFSEGASAGPGAWAMAAGDPNVLLETMQEGFEEPVVADVEMISSAGRALGFLRLPLQNKVATATDGKDARTVLALKTPEAAKPLKRSAPPCPHPRAPQNRAGAGGEAGSAGRNRVPTTRTLATRLNPLPSRTPATRRTNPV